MPLDMMAHADSTATRCPECRACILGRAACLDHFHALLGREPELLAQVTSAERRGVTHFYAVASYVLQHPESMGYTVAALANVRHLLERHLSGQATLSRVRAEIRRAANRDGRILRLPTDPPVQCATREWPITIEDVLGGNETDYARRVVRWATSVILILGREAQPREEERHGDRNRIGTRRARALEPEP